MKSQSLPHTCVTSPSFLCEKNHILLNGNLENWGQFFHKNLLYVSKSSLLGQQNAKKMKFYAFNMDEQMKESWNCTNQVLKY